MPQFKVKNLMIDVVSAKAAEIAGECCLFPTVDCFLTFDCNFRSLVCPGNSIVCRDPSVIACRRGSCLITDGCGLNYSTCAADSGFYLIDLERLVINPDDIKVVQAQLNETLKAVGVRAQRVAKDMAPQTLAQAELLEEQLEGALKEVKAIKAELK